MSDEDTAILRMLAGRMTDNEIAFALSTPPEYVAERITAILKELDAGTREDAVTRAVELSIIV